MKNAFLVIGAVIAAVAAFLVFSRSKSSAESDVDLGTSGGGSWLDDLNSMFAGLGGGESVAASTKYKALVTYYQEKPGELAMEAGMPVVRDLNEIQEGQSAVYIQEYAGIDESGPVEAPVLVEKYQGMNIISPIETATPTPTTQTEAEASNRAVKQLIDTIQAKGLSTTDPADLKTIGELDQQIRLAVNAGAGVSWEDTHMSIDQVAHSADKAFTTKTAQRWLTDIASFEAQGGIISAEEKAKIQQVAAGI